MITRISRVNLRWIVMIGLGSIAVPASVSCDQDPTHDDEVSALGPEDPGVPHGPLHRPGQPCLTCHGGSGPGSPQFSVAGTIYQVLGAKTPLSQGTVQITDATNASRSVLTNAAGNFYISLDDWAPVAPLYVSVSFQGVSASMSTRVGRDGSCADCHFGTTATNLTPGIVYLSPSAGGFPGGSP